MTSLPQTANPPESTLAAPAPAGAGAMLVVLGLLLGIAAFLLAAFFDARIALGLVGLAVFGVATLRSPYLGMLLYVLILYVRPGETGLVPDSLHFERVVALGLMVIVALHRLLGHGKPLPANPLNRVMLAFLGVVCLGVPFAYWKGGALGEAIDLGKLCLLYVGVVYLADDLRKVRALIWVALLAWAWYGFSAISGYINGTSVYYGEGHLLRAMGPTTRFGDADTLANILVCAIPFVGLLLWAERNRLSRLLLAACGLLYVGGIVVTGSRTGLLGLGFMIFLVALASRRRVIATALIALVLAGAWLVTPEALKTRYLSVGDYQSQATWIARRDTWQVGERMLLEHPLFGVGAGGFGAARHDQYDGSWLAPHSVYVQVGAELGLTGIVCFLALIWYLLRENHRLRRALRAGPDSGDAAWATALSLALEINLFTLLFVGITGHNLYNPSYYLIAALTVCLARFASSQPAPAPETKKPAVVAAG